jgi:hypothetical protein
MPRRFMYAKLTLNLPQQWKYCRVRVPWTRPAEKMRWNRRHMEKEGLDFGADTHNQCWN